MQSSDLLFDLGELELPIKKDEQIASVTQAMNQIIDTGKVPVVLGGDHLVKYSLMQSVKAKKPNTGILYIDAYPDTDPSQELYYGSILYHAIKELGYRPEKILILGLRQCTSAEVSGLEELGISYILASEFELASPREMSSKILEHFSFCTEVAVSIDLDTFDPAVAPAVEAPLKKQRRLSWRSSRTSQPRQAMVGEQLKKSLPCFAHHFCCSTMLHTRCNHGIVGQTIQ